MSSAGFISRYKIFHLLFWLLLFGLWYFFRYDDFVNKKLFLQITLLKVADLALMVYITNYLLIPYLLYRKRYLAFAVLFLLLVFLTSWLKMYIEGQLMNNPAAFDLSRNLKRRVYDNMIPHLLLVSTGAGFKLLLDYARAQRRMGEMAKENAEAELNFLKSQINPHFVFNSLNSVYFLIDKQNTDAREALHKFSDMLRYQLYECNGDQTAIEKELAYLTDYIELQKLRKDERCVVSFHTQGDLSGFSIPPLLLIPFVENAFKHLSHYADRDNTIHISVSGQQNRFVFTVANSKETGKRDTELVKQGGIGLKNVQRRLALLYPGKHSLTVDNTIDIFTIQLQLDLA
jgi:two-component system LytT family sensor kinase